MKVFLIILSIVLGLVLAIWIMVAIAAKRRKAAEERYAIQRQKEKERMEAEAEIRRQKWEKERIVELEKVKVESIPDTLNIDEYVSKKTTNFMELVDKCTFLTQRGISVNTHELLVSFFDKISFPKNIEIGCRIDGDKYDSRQVVYLKEGDDIIQSTDMLGKVNVTFDYMGVWQAVLLTTILNKRLSSLQRFITSWDDVEDLKMNSDEDEMNRDDLGFIEAGGLLPVFMKMKDDKIVVTYCIWADNMNEANHVIQYMRDARKMQDTIAFTKESEEGKEIYKWSQRLHINFGF